MEAIRMILKIVMWILIIGFGCNFIMQIISYSFYKRAKPIKNVSVTSADSFAGGGLTTFPPTALLEGDLPPFRRHASRGGGLSIMPERIQINDRLTGYGCNLNLESDNIIIMFGGSGYIAYNAIGMFGGYYECPVFAVDYYGTQDSSGKMNLKTMQQSSVDLYDWAIEQYPDKNITVIGHSYGAGMAAYLASVRDCSNLFLLAAYRDLSDLYNKIIPIFWGPAKVFISNNIKAKVYAKNTTCNVYIFGSNADKNLSAALQKKVAMSYEHAEINIFQGIKHEEYLIDKHVISKIKEIL